MPIDLQKVRKDTPGCSKVLHFNNAGAALMPQQVISAMEKYMHLEALQGGYEAAFMQDKVIQKFYVSASKLIGCERSEIAFIENATRAWDMAFYSLDFKTNDKILTSVAEYGSNYIAFLQVAKKTGAKIEVIENDEFGQLSIKDLERKIDKSVKLIAITYVPTQGGLINPAEEVGAIAKEANIFYLLDATQSVGQMPIDVKKIKCDALCATGRKYLRGPRGTGFLYVNKDVVQSLEPPFLDVQAAKWTNTYVIQPDATRFETWETNYAAKIGLGAAIDYALEIGLDEIWKRIKYLGAHFRKCLKDVPGVILHDLGVNKCGIVTFTVNGYSAADIQAKLFEKKINVSVSKAEYARLDMDMRGLSAIVRASVHCYNTEEEVARFCDVIRSEAT